MLNDEATAGLLLGRRIVVAVSGGIAAYKSCTLVRLLIRAGALVRVAMTRHATEFVTPLTFQTLTNAPVVVDLFNAPSCVDQSSEHIDLSRWTDLVIVAPATANIIAKAATGLADDFVSTLLLATTCPVVYAPAMNTAMWLNPATVANVETLDQRGAVVLPTGTGALADKQEFGQGRLLEPEELLVHVIENLPPSGPLVGRKMVVTAGPTWEPLDPVRMLTNRSSGKMGFAVATAAVAQGMDVTLIAGPNSLTPPPRADLIAVESAQEMHQAVEAEFPNCDVLVMSAAVADWKPTSVSDEKIKKDQGPPVVEMVPNPDILLEIGKLRTSGQILVGFAMETSDEEDNARKKLRSKNLDILVLNRLSDPDAGFAVDTNVVTIFAADGAVTKLPTLSKRDVGDRLVALILSELEGRDDRTDAEGGNRIHRPADSSG